MAFLEAIVEYLESESDLTDLIDKKIYPNIIPDKLDLPALVYETISTTEHKTIIAGNFGLITQYIEFTAYSETKTQCSAIIEVIRDLFLNYNESTFGDYNLQLATIDSRDDGYNEKYFWEGIEIEFKYT